MTADSNSRPDGGTALEPDGRTVLFSFLSRADATPLNERSRAEGFTLDRDGRAVVDPAADPTVLALEPDPNLNFEHWGSYWRKVHGPRFVHPDETDDAALIAKLLRYDQIHRVAAGPSNADVLPYVPPLDADGRLFDTVIGHVPPYHRPEWDGVAYLQFAGPADMQAMLGSDRVRRKIFPEDQAIFRDLAPLLARQYEVIARDTRSDVVVMVRTHVRREGMSRQDFVRDWLDLHASDQRRRDRLCDKVRRYALLENIGPSASDQPFYHAATAGIDGVSLIAFGSMLDAERFVTSEAHRRILADEDTISRNGHGSYWSGVTFTVVDDRADDSG